MKQDLPSGLRWTAIFLFLFGTVPPGRAQNVTGVTDKEILIGSCSALEGPSRSLGLETVAGAKAYLSLINDTGGVNGRSSSCSRTTTATTPRRRRRALIA
jgi:ABC-type branched-subunit amino acid transport system substrate-binding protein